MTAPRHRLTFATGGHFTFSDLCALNADAIATADDIGVGNVLNDGCSMDNTAADAAFPTIRHFAIGLMNASLRGSTGTQAMLTNDVAQALSGGDATYVQ